MSNSIPQVHKTSQIHQVRIIGGQWKRTPLPVLTMPGLRPTPDRVRETLFNWLHHRFDGQWAGRACLDLFAGTGVLGFEAASRGARRVVLVEANRRVAEQLRVVQKKLQATQIDIVIGDAFCSVQRLRVDQGGQREKALQKETRFDVIFLDPPYHAGWIEKILPLCIELLTEDGVVYVEAESALTEEQWPDWEVIRAARAGMVFYHLLQRKNNNMSQA